MWKKRLLLAMLFALLIGLVPAQAQDVGGGGTLVGAFDVGPGGLNKAIPFMDTRRSYLAVQDLEPAHQLE